MCTPHGDASQFEPLPSACTRAHMWILKWLGAPLLSAQTPPCASRFWSLHAGLAVHVCAIAPSCCSVSPTKYHYGSIDCIRVWWSWRADNSGHFLINTTIVNCTHSGSQHPSRYLTLKSSVPSVASSGPACFVFCGWPAMPGHVQKLTVGLIVDKEQTKFRISLDRLEHYYYYYYQMGWPE